MAEITLRGNLVKTSGELPAVGSTAPAFTLTKTDLSDVTLEDFKNKTIIMNISPSVDTSFCAASVRRFNSEASNLKDTVVLYISADLPFAHKRFCEVEGLENVIPLSDFRSPEFGTDYGLRIESGPMKGLCSRVIIIIDAAGKVIYNEQVPEIAQEPDYDSALAALK